MGGVMAHAAVRVGSNTVESVITRKSAEEMNLKKSDKVTAVIKSTEVMLQKDESRPPAWIAKTGSGSVWNHYPKTEALAKAAASATIAIGRKLVPATGPIFGN